MPRRPTGYEIYGFDEAQIDRCLALLHRAIILSAWLAATARDQLWRFKEFKLWLQSGAEAGILLCTALTRGPDSESNRAHAEDGKLRTLSGDILEVNRYLMDGLGGCELDNWFDGGGVPTTTPDDLRAPPPSKTLAAVLEEAKQALDDPARLSWEMVEWPDDFGFCIVLSQGQTKQQADIGHLDRNMVELVKEIARTCQTVFAGAGTRVGQMAVVHNPWAAPSEKGKEREMETLRMRERTTIEVGVARSAELG